ncbi:MAG: FAD-binding oxidoreductase [Brevirhabdus sp.]
MLNPADVAFESTLREQLAEAAFRPLSPSYLEEPRGRYSRKDALVLAPANAGEVATILKACNDARVGVVPYGGGTGLVAGQVDPVGPCPVVLSTERMTAIRQVLADENVLVAEAGAILQDIHDAAEAVDRLYPLSLAAKGSARIGGNLATNAGGVNVLRYGNARAQCLGIEAVLPDGRILNGLTRLRKDNTGYDLRDLLIGSEGTLGIITAATLRLSPRPSSQGTAIFVVPDPSAALKLLSLAFDQVGEQVSGFELISGAGLEFLAATQPQVRQPFAAHPVWCVLVDLGLSGGLLADEALEVLFAAAFEAGFVSDGVIARSEAQRAQFWEVRETIPLANKAVGSIASHDISLPLGAISGFIETAGAALTHGRDIRINCFGHLGDGNLHYNLFPAVGRDRAEYDTERDALTRIVHDLVHEMGGSISAEHGIGRLKAAELERYGDPAKLAMMRAIKSALDPNGIMNPGAVLRAM